MRQIAIYGKGGIGKSLIASHLSFAWAKRGLRVLQIGCDPKQDSTRLLLKKRKLSSILDLIKDKGFYTENIALRQAIYESHLLQSGQGKIFCAESGGPEPGIGCAGKGIAEAIEALNRFDIFRKLNLDAVIYDVLGDVVCGGFSLPIREGYAQETYIITSGEFEALFAACNIAKVIARFAPRSGARLGGIIGNLRGIKSEKETIKKFAQLLQAKVVGFIPHSKTIKECSFRGETLFQFVPHSEECAALANIADKIWEQKRLSVPRTLDTEKLYKWWSGLSHG